MKKYYVLTLIGSMLLGTGCKENTLVFPEAVDERVVESDLRTPVKPDYIDLITDYDGGDIQFSWPEIDEERIKAIKIVYEKDGQEELIEITDFSEFFTLEKMEIGHAYDFVITAIGLKDEVSKPFHVTATPQPYAHDLVASNVAIAGGARQAEVIWLNVTKQKIQVDVIIGDVVYSSEPDNKLSSSMIIPIPRGNYDAKIVVTDSVGRSSSPILASFRVLDAVIADPKDWLITVSTNEPSEGSIANLTDGRLDTYWHSMWSGAGSTYPHWIRIDLKKEEIVSQVDLAPRHNNTNGFNSFNVEGSLDGVNWTRVLNSQTLNTSLKALQNYPFPSPQTFRYIRINALAGGAASTNLAELRIYTYQ